jgi:hypothetical protein
VDCDRAEGRKFAKQLLAVWRVSIIRLVVAKIIPNGRKQAVGLIGVNLDINVGCDLLSDTQLGAEKQKRKEENSLGHEVDSNRIARLKPNLCTSETKRKTRAGTLPDKQAPPLQETRLYWLFDQGGTTPDIRA